jgi:hypothetical protein
MTASITTKTTIILLTATLDSAWALIRASRRLYAALDKLPWVPAALWRACRRVETFGQYLEALAERTAQRLGIDIMDVLEPVVAARIG